jgi:phosphoglucomutase
VVTGSIQERANAYIAAGLVEVKRMPLARRVAASTTRRHDYLQAYVEDLAQVVDLDPLRGSGLRLGWIRWAGPACATGARSPSATGLPLTIVSDEVDPTFRFMTVDRDGKIRMDCSSPWAMQRLLGLADRFDVAWGCDPDHDRHGSRGRQQRPHESERLLASRHLVSLRPPARMALARRRGQDGGEQQHDRPRWRRLARRCWRCRSGFKWFVDGLMDGALGFGGEESAGATFPCAATARPVTTD